MQDLTNKYSANASCNGWEFEYAAAIFIFLEYMKEVDQIGIEKGDDIELRLKNGDIIYAQAKSSLDIDNITNLHLEDILKSLKTLSVNSDNGKSLISIFNYHTPLGPSDSFLYSEIYDKKCFCDLTKTTREKLKKKIENKYEIDFNKVEFWFLKFEGKEKIHALRCHLSNKFSSLCKECSVNADDILESWLLLIMENGARKHNLIDADILSGTLFMKILKSFNYNLQSIIDEYNISNFLYEDYIKDRLINFMDKNFGSFSIYNSIRSEYIKFVEKNRSITRENRIKEFTNDYCCKNETPLYISGLFEDLSYNLEEKDEINKNAYKIFVHLVCKYQSIIQKIKEIFGYDN